MPNMLGVSEKKKRGLLGRQGERINSTEWVYIWTSWGTSRILVHNEEIRMEKMLEVLDLLYLKYTIESTSKVM